MSDQRREARAESVTELFSETEILLRQQTTLARFGEVALRSESLDDILEEACRLAGEALGTDLAKVLELQPDGRTLLVRAGVGWRPGIVGHATVEASETSAAGHVLRTNEPVISVDLRHETRFSAPDFLHDHGVCALVSVVIIGGQGRPYFGVLEVDSRVPRHFDDNDIAFLRTYANLLAAAVDRLRVLHERRRAEALIRASSEVLYSLDADWSEIRQLKGGGFLADTETANRSWLTDYIPEDERPRVEEAIREAIATKTLYQLEHRVRLANGEIGWALSRAVPLLDAAGKVTEWFGAASDVTARHQAEDALRRSASWLRQAQVAGKIGAFTLSVSDGMLYPTPEFCRLYGVPVRETMPAREIEALTVAEDFASISTDASRLQGNAVGDTTYRIHRRDTGELRWIARRAEFEYDAQGRPVSFSGIVRDITAEREQSTALARLNRDLEQRVEERTRELDRIWRLSRDMLGVADADGVWLSVNPAWTDILGWTKEELIGRTTSWMQHPDDLDSTQERRDSLKAGNALLGFEHRLHTRDSGYRVIHWTAVPSEGLIYAVGRDVTAEREQAVTLARTEEALRQSQKMEAVGQLTGGLAHDFNNLLTGVTGSLELLQTRIAQGRINEIDRYVNAAQGAAKRAAALTHRLLAFSRRQTLAPKPTDINRLVWDMEDLIRRTVGPEIVVERMVAAAGLWTTLVDPGQLENALLNLCINARDAMPDGGKLTIETANRWFDDRTARDRDLAPGQYVSLSVSDTGIGMPADVIAKAFDPFFTTKPIGQGTGLGLSMIYGFAKQSNGQVHIYSEVGQGTMVSIYLPRHIGDAETDEDPVGQGASPRAEDGQTVLVVEDDPVVRMLVTEVLNDLGYRAIEAADGTAGLQVLHSEARIDLLVTDVGLPGAPNGRQVADAARAARPALNVLFITGYAENAVLSHGHLEPGMHVLTKPFALDELARRIKDLLETPGT